MLKAAVVILVLQYAVVLGRSVKCLRPELPEEANISTQKEEYEVGEGIRISCTDKSLVEGDGWRQCTSNGTWTGVMPLCKAPLVCKDGFMLDDNRTCVTATPFQANWADTRRYCLDNGKDLLVVQNSSQLDQVVSYLNSSGLSSAWIAGRGAKQWHWYNDYKTIEDEANWGRGEPSDMGIMENYLQMMMKLDYRWNDANGDETVSDMNIGGTVNKFICEYPYGCENLTLHKTDPYHDFNGTSCFVFEGKDEHDLYDGRCVEWNEVNINHQDPNYWKTYCYKRGISWFDAKNKCEKEGGRLAVLDSEEKVDQITRLIRYRTLREPKFHGNYWFGAFFDKHHGRREWTWGDRAVDLSTDIKSPPFIYMGCGTVTSSGDVVAKKCYDEKYSGLCAVSQIQTLKCGVPPLAKNAKPLHLKATFQIGKTHRHECKKGFKPLESGEVKFCECLPSGRWNEDCSTSITCVPEDIEGSGMSADPFGK